MVTMEAEVKIVYEDDDVLVVDKPTGWITTVENERHKISHKYLELWARANRPNSLVREGIIHRLDKNTSGLIILAKNESAMVALKKQFKDRVIVKKYVALVGGEFPSEAEVEMPIGRSNYGFERFAVREDGKTAWTVITRLKKLVREGKFYSLVEVGLKTGRTHQIRVHLSYLRYPIVGDRLYGGEMRIDRQFLQAKYLKFCHPKNGKVVELDRPLAADLVGELKNYEEI